MRTVQSHLASQFTRSCASAASLVSLFLLVACSPTRNDKVASNPAAGIESFNRAFAEATRNMQNRAVLDLWEEGGISLLPSTPPIIGKQSIGKLLEDIRRQYPDAHMLTFEQQCFDIQVSGNLATEWCTEHQIVKLGADKPPFEGYGKMLLVMHRDAAGVWHLRQEMWNQALAPKAADS